MCKLGTCWSCARISCTITTIFVLICRDKQACVGAGQLNEIELENQQLKSNIEDLESRCRSAQEQHAVSAGEAQRLQQAVDHQNSQAQALAADLEAAR